MYFIKIILFVTLFANVLFSKEEQKIAYIVSDLSIPFWDIMKRGVDSEAKQFAYELEVYNSNNNQKTELENVINVIKSKPLGVIISPTNSSSCVTMLSLFEKANIPVVISDIGTNSGKYVSYISSDNKTGAYEIGKILSKKMIDAGIQNSSVGIIAIPQKRENGKKRTLGFIKALKEEGIKSADIRQQVSFSKKETYNYTKELIHLYPNMGALWLQGSDKYQGALDAIKESKREILLITFDAEPEFLELIPKGILLGAGMQQPFLMGETSVKTLNAHLQGKKVSKNIELPILAISKKNIENKLDLIKRNVLGINEK